MALTFCFTSTRKSSTQLPEIQEQGSGKAGRATAMDQMLQPYKLEDYA